MDSLRTNPLVLGMLTVLGLTSVVMAGAVWARRQRVVAFGPLVILILAVAQLLLAYAMSFASVSGSIVDWCLDFSYLGWLAAPPAALAYVAQVTERDRWLTTAVRSCLAAMALGFAAVIWGPVPHSVFYGVGRDPVTHEFPATAAFLAFYCYSLSLLVVACILVVAELRRPRAMNTRQAVLVLIAMAMPLVLSITAALNVSVAHVFLNIPALFVTVVLLYLVARYRPMDLRHLAETAGEGSGAEGIVVFGTDRRISEINAAAVRLLGPGRSPAMGLRVEEVWSDAPDVLNGLRTGPVNLVAVVDQRGRTRHLLFARSEMSDAQGDVVGWLVRVRDTDTGRQGSAR